MKLYDFVESLASKPFLAQSMIEEYLKEAEEEQCVNISSFISNKISCEEGFDEKHSACETKVVRWES